MNRLSAIIKRYWQPVVALNVVIMAVAFVAAQTVEKVWSAEAKLILPSTPTDLNLNLGTLGNLGGNEGLVFSQQVDSRQILASIILSDDSVKRAWESDPEKELYSHLSDYKSLFAAEPDDGSTVISLSVEGSSPEIARRRLSLLISSFQQRLNELRRIDALQRSQFIQQELVDAERNLAEAERKLVAFQESFNLIDSESQTKELVAAISSLRVTQGEASAKFEASKSQVSALANRLGQTPAQAVRALQLSENQEYQAVQKKLSELEVEISDAQSQFTPEHPQMQYLLAQRDTLLRQRQTLITQATTAVSGVNTSVGENYAKLVETMIVAESEARAWQKQTAQLQDQVEQLNIQLQKMPSAKAQLSALQRQYNISESVYNGLIAQIQAARVNAFSTYPNVQVLDQPSTDPTPVGPGRKPIALGAILASLFGSMAIVLFLNSRNPLLTVEDVHRAGLPIVGKIPRLRRVKSNLIDRQTTEFSFQSLASAVSLSPPESSCFIITSANRGEGKTTVVLGLANALIHLGFRVLVVDADFHHPELTASLGCVHQKSLNLDNQPISIHPGLDLLIPIPHNQGTAEFVARGGFEHSLHQAQRTGKYDYILIDTSPTSLTHEAALMSKSLGNVLLIVWPGVSNRNPFFGSLEQLKRHQANIWGLIINGMETANESYLYNHHEVEVE